MKRPLPASGDRRGGRVGRQTTIRASALVDPRLIELVTLRVMPEPDLVVPSRDGTRIVAFRSGASAGPPLVLVHGSTADHTTFRVIGPRLATDWTVHAIDRRGRGASGDTLPYAIEREFEDVAAVADALATDHGTPVDVVGHSYGGRAVLGAALMTKAIGRVVSYEGAPTPAGASYHPAGIEDRLRARLAAGDRDGALATFLAEVVGLTAADLAAYRANPVWPVRAAAAGTILRELEAEVDPAASLDALSGVRQPVLQILGGASLPVFREATSALDERLADGHIVVIDGARHAAHHTHPDALVTAIRTFLT
jgi:pimeloyl-ACP methyl ester carboxylesterase